MRKVILNEFVTLNGMASGPEGSVDYVPASMQGDRGFGQEQFAFLDTIDTILLGRVTYTMFARHWPNVTEREEKPFADKLNSTPKVVFSRTLDRAPWGQWPEARIARGSAAEEVASLRRQPGKDMVVWGSISLARSLMAAGLIDEYRLVVCPVVLGGGTPLFEGGVPPLGLNLLSARPYDRGAVGLTYVPAGSQAR